MQTDTIETTLSVSSVWGLTTKIPGRDGLLLYRAKIPQAWIHEPATDPASLLDTTRPISEFSIVEGEEKISITIHNFPQDQLSERIPPGAQIARWKKQFVRLNPVSVKTTPQAFGGFSGLCFEAQGEIRGKPTAVIGWAMQLGAEHFRIVKNRQVRADYTIKVVGPQELIKKHQTEILAFGRSFELIEAIPSSR